MPTVVPGHQPSNVTDQPHNRGMFQQKTTADSGLQSQLVCHKDPAVNLNARFDCFDDCGAGCLGRVHCTRAFAVVLTSYFVAGSPSACNTTSVCPHVSNVCATDATVSTDQSFVDCTAINAPVGKIVNN